ncbi:MULTISPECIES: GAF and ANTAR domain-containing protein [Streptomyces]|nr:GAF and ANTAR domain-containing protein [Streptomyces ruber]
MDDNNRAMRLWRLLLTEAAQQDGSAFTVGLACHVAAQMLPADSVVVTLINAAEIREVAFATDDLGHRLEDAQLIAGEGPCTDAFGQNRQVMVPDLAQERDRWPAYLTLAAPLDARATLSCPLGIGPARIGCVSYYRHEPGPFSDGDRGNAAAYTQLFTLAALCEHGTVLLHRSLPTTTPPASPRPHGFPVLVHQAIGALSARLDTDIATASACLRAYAYAHDAPLLHVAEQVLAGTITPEADIGDDTT